jgi:hypothetical protein
MELELIFRIYYAITFIFSLWFMLVIVNPEPGLSTGEVVGCVLVSMCVCSFAWPMMVYRLARPLKKEE